MRGDRGAVTGLRSLVSALEADGHEILTKHLLEDGVDAAEGSLRERDVYERDVRWLDSCDVLIAEASGSSYGVGFEVGYVLGRSDQTRQRVVLLYRRDRRDQVSRLIAGNSHARCSTIAYDTPGDLISLVPQSLKPKTQSPKPKA